MALEPITRQEQIIAGKELEPITRMEKFLKEYGGGSGGGAVSWNDLTDRPFYEEVTRVELLPETTVTINSTGYAQGTGLIGLVAGNTYIVTWDGTEYECVAEIGSVKGMTGVAIGNSYAFGGENNDIPFAIADVHDYGMHTFVGFALGDHIVSISRVDTVVKTIDPKYLPDTVATKDDLEAAIGTAIGGSY